MIYSSIKPSDVFLERPTTPTAICVAIAFHAQVLHATTNASPNNLGALPFTFELVDEISLNEAFSRLEAPIWQQAMDF